MAVTLVQLIQKATGTINALEAMSSKERERTPSAAFAQDFNKFRTMALEVKPDISEIAPAAIEIGTEPGFRIPKANYAEILAYWQQMRELL